MHVRVERDVTSQVIAKLLEPVDAELGPKDALERNSADARSSKAGEVAERNTTQAWGTGDVGHDKGVTWVGV